MNLLGVFKHNGNSGVEYVTNLTMDHHLENDMKKRGATAVLMASLGLLAACQDSPEDKMESARESMSDAAENIGDAMKDTGNAIEQRTDEAFGNEPTTTERRHDNLDAAGDRISEAYEDSTDYLAEKGDQARESAAEARDQIQERLDRESKRRLAVSHDNPGRYRGRCCFMSTLPFLLPIAAPEAARGSAPVWPSALPAPPT